jgi:hypothetical protein
MAGRSSQAVSLLGAFLIVLAGVTSSPAWANVDLSGLDVCGSVDETLFEKLTGETLLATDESFGDLSCFIGSRAPAYVEITVDRANGLLGPASNWTCEATPTDAVGEVASFASCIGSTQQKYVLNAFERGVNAEIVVNEPSRALSVDDLAPILGAIFAQIPGVQDGGATPPALSPSAASSGPTSNYALKVVLESWDYPYENSSWTPPEEWQETLEFTGDCRGGGACTIAYVWKTAEFKPYPLVPAGGSAYSLTLIEDLGALHGGDFCGMTATVNLDITFIGEQLSGRYSFVPDGGGLKTIMEGDTEVTCAEYTTEYAFTGELVGGFDPSVAVPTGPVPRSTVAQEENTETAGAVGEAESGSDSPGSRMPWMAAGVLVVLGGAAVGSVAVRRAGRSRRERPDQGPSVQQSVMQPKHDRGHQQLAISVPPVTVGIRVRQDDEPRFTVETEG